MTERVPEERWLEAQRWERDTWVRVDRHTRRLDGWRRRLLGLVGLDREPVGDDWNYWWREQFDHYQAIPTTIENAVELGCGPFTNIRLLLDRCEVEHLFCSDPLARHYLRLRSSWLSRFVPTGRVLLDDHPIEQCPYADQFFGLVLLINVLDHVRDARRCVSEAVRILGPGGLLILGQDLTNAEDAARFPDIGHPIRLDHDWLDGLLAPSFHPRLRRVLPREAGRNPDAHYGTYLFIGEKAKQ